VTAIRQTEILGTPYVLTKFSVRQQIPLQAKVATLVGATADLSNGLSSVLQGFGRGIIEAGGYELVEELLSKTCRDGVKLDTEDALDAAFRDNGGELVLAIEWVIRENFGSFFADGVRVMVQERILTPLFETIRGNAGQQRSWLAPFLTTESTPSPPNSDSPS